MPISLRLSLFLSAGFFLTLATAAPADDSSRPAWTTSRVHGSPEPPKPYRTERVFPRLKFDRPVAMMPAPGSGRLFVAELGGKLYSFPNQPDVTRADLFFDGPAEITGLTRLYDLTFDPEYQQNRYVYLSYITERQDPRGTKVSRFTVTDANPPRVEPESELVLIEWQSGGHNGGCLRFGPDGLLYISTGDASSPSPPDGLNTGQDISDLLASILRIDVRGASQDRPYRIPPDNPFIDHDSARPEVWAYGLRNPWKMSFDDTGNLWVGDVGWELWEMIYRIESGGNYGWSITEGPQPVRPEIPRGPTPIRPPAAAHSHIESRSITGGAVYRGDRLSQLRGAYIYGDYVTGKLWSFRDQDGQVTERQEIADSSLAIITFGETREGELFIVGYDGTIHRLVPNAAEATNSKFPVLLSETGLFESVEQRTPATGVIPYRIVAEPWMDGARAERAIAMPGTSKLDVYRSSNAQVGNLKGQWEFPAETVFVKTLSLETAPDRRQPVETQLLHRDGETWKGYTFAWNDDGTDAELVPTDGTQKTYHVVDESMPAGRRQQTWRFASRTECLVCHTTRSGSIQGFRVEQLDRPIGSGRNQLTNLVEMRLFDDPDPLLAKLKVQPHPLTDPSDTSADLQARARSYLDLNCAHCHIRGGGGTANFEVRRELPLERTGLVGERPTQGTFELFAPEIVAAGDPHRSVLFYRMATLGRGRMPHVGSRVIDQSGLGLIREWIASLPAEQPSLAVRKLRKEQATILARMRTEESAVDELLASTSGALQLLSALDEGTLSPTVQQRIIEAATDSTPPHIRGLFERFLPESRRSKRLGESVDLAMILGLNGDAKRGRDLFLNATGVQCRNCHQVSEQGRNVGPRLDGVGKRLSRRQLLESILDPSAVIDEKFRTWLVQTADGRVISGLLIERTDQAVVLRGTDGKDVRVPMSDVEQLVPAQKSLMPDLLARDLTAKELADLLSFLQSLQTPPTEP
ncbi:PQQ-dependent sugar dehydrogenase [Thalassoroseus pseudoceratinae]|uniref:PQQ-dependent sugar dehydrogenase n=1 Tax=Thalassoroseus pseudoceratinae TaxID=2713176 RepID=UPI0014204567|nr:PQQ-dependent sugar dehydrogenase [Thalassoroseus pseudoceratinae]